MLMLQFCAGYQSCVEAEEQDMYQLWPSKAAIWKEIATFSLDREEIVYPFYLMKKRFYPLSPDGQEVVAFPLDEDEIRFLFFR